MFEVPHSWRVCFIYPVTDCQGQLKGRRTDLGSWSRGWVKLGDWDNTDWLCDFTWHPSGSRKLRPEQGCGIMLKAHPVSLHLPTRRYPPEWLRQLRTNCSNTQASVGYSSPTCPCIWPCLKPPLWHSDILGQNKPDLVIFTNTNTLHFPTCQAMIRNTEIHRCVW